MNDLQSKPAVLHATIEIKRAATGKVDVFHLTGTPVEPPAPVEQAPVIAGEPPCP
jgi:hypothetical protein